MSHTAIAPDEIPVSRRRSDRRTRSDRRVSQTSSYPGAERREGDRRKVERRRMIDPTTCERDYSEQEVEFMRAMDDYKRRSGRQFPTWSEVLEVIRDLGYRKIAPESQSYSES
jgi:hypothetical protein